MSAVEQIREHLAKALPLPALKPLTAAQFLALELPPRELILAPWLASKGLAMIFAKTGVGKTQLGVELAYAVAGGFNVLGWQAPKARRVLYVDGEMPAQAMQERLANVARRYDAAPPPENLSFLSADLIELGIPDLATEEGQSALLAALGDAEVIVLDNLSTLFRSGKENEAESWANVQPFLLELRRQGRAVVLIHHAGKGGDQRGTSKRLDVLDTVIRLERPDDYDAGQGARFIVSFDKSRGFYGQDAEPFEAWLDGDHWKRQSVRDAKDEEILALLDEGLSQRKIAREIGLDVSNVSRRVASLKAQGRLP